MKQVQYDLAPGRAVTPTWLATGPDAPDLGWCDDPSTVIALALLVALMLLVRVGGGKRAR